MSRSCLIWLCWGPQLCNILHSFWYCLTGLYQEVSIWFIVTLVFSYVGAPSLYSLVFKGVYWSVFLLYPTRSSGNHVWLPWGDLLYLGWKVIHVNTGLVLVLKFVPECCSPHFLIVVAPGALPTFLYSCFWSLWLFLLHYYGWTFLVYLVWWCIHHHIKLPMILMGLSVFLVKCGSDLLDWLYLVAGVLLYVSTP